MEYLLLVIRFPKICFCGGGGKVHFKVLCNNTLKIIPVDLSKIFTGEFPIKKLNKHFKYLFHYNLFVWSPNSICKALFKKLDFWFYWVICPVLTYEKFWERTNIKKTINNVQIFKICLISPDNWPLFCG